jgi:ABC-2 type transport system ATP-binding protein
MLGCDVAKDQQAIRERIGVVFQSPSLDRKLTARENILFQAALYGIGQREAKSRLDELSGALRVKDQLDIKIDKLSGGLRRRVELVKGLLHRPELLLLDEPSTGLDPLSRLELWQSLEELRLEHSTTIVLTTHLLEEAEKCDRIAILDQGRLLVDDSPEALRKSTGQIVFSVATNEPDRVVEQLEKQYGYHGSIHGGSVRIVRQQTDISPMDVYASLGSLVTSMTIGPPSLEDVFLRIAGKSFS